MALNGTSIESGGVACRKSGQTEHRPNMDAQGSDFDKYSFVDIALDEESRFSKSPADLADLLGTSKINPLVKFHTWKMELIEIRALGAHFRSAARLTESTAGNEHSPRSASYAEPLEIPQKTPKLTKRRKTTSAPSRFQAEGKQIATIAARYARRHEGSRSRR